ncbi:hypothetical protein AEM51_03890 [Bacteroidetes bacterium UKL13-3]|nr:hypothetical protein AEM51_03890 [Bacteroidetes bacterium UKL13-3]
MSSNDFFGAGSASTIFEIHGTNGFQTSFSGDRFATKISGFKVIAYNESCDNYCAIKSKVSSGISDRGIGFKFSNIEIGNGSSKHFGAAFFITDCFRLSIQNVGITNCMNAIALYGQVVGATITDVTSNFDHLPFSTTVIPLIFGGSTSIGCGVYVRGASHSGIYQIPESIKITNSSFVQHDIGIYHHDGLFCKYHQVDLDFCRRVGFYSYSDNGCSLSSSYIAVRNPDQPTYGIYIDSNDVANIKQLNLIENYIVGYSENHSDSIAINCNGDRPGSPVIKQGFSIIRNEIKSLNPAFKFKYGIYIGHSKHFELSSNIIYADASSSEGISSYAPEFFAIRDNTVIGNNISLTVGDTPHEISNNECTNMTLLYPSSNNSPYNTKLADTVKYNNFIMDLSGGWTNGFLRIGEACIWYDYTNNQLRAESASSPSSENSGSVIV